MEEKNEEKNEEKELILCSLLDAALHAELHEDNPADIKQKCEKIKQQKTDWKSILSIADNHRVLPLLYDVLEDILPENGEDWKRVEEKSIQTVGQSYRLLFMSRYVTGLLEDAGMHTILLKGSGIAGLYPVPELRKSGDVDLLFEDEQTAQKAGSYLLAHGFMAEGGHHWRKEWGLGELPFYYVEIAPFNSTEKRQRTRSRSAASPSIKTTTRSLSMARRSS